MTNILAVTAPIYLVIGVGYLAMRLGVMHKTDGQAMGRFVLNFALPTMLFNALASRSFAQLWHADYLAAYTLGSLLAFGTMFSACKWWRRKDATTSALMAMGASCSNSGYIGYPIALQLLGPVAGVGLALTLLAENLLVIPLGLSLAECGQVQHQSWQHIVRNSLKRLTQIPMMWGIAAGMSYSLMGWHLPEVLGKTVNLLAATCAGVALFVNGGSLVGLQVQGLAKQVSGVAVAKLLLHPLGVALFLWLFGPVDASLQVVGIVLAAMPMMGIYPILEQRFGLAGLTTAALLVTTIASFVSISTLLWGMTHVPTWAVLIH